MTNVLEKFNYKTQPDASAEALLQAANKSSEWLKGQPGFHYRTLLQEADGSWTDLLFWQSEADLKAADEKFMAADANAAFMALIDPPTVTRTCYPQKHVAMGMH